ncbi:MULTISPECIES: hypothetical protein [unclassified Streptomyces]
MENSSDSSYLPVTRCAVHSDHSTDGWSAVPVTAFSSRLRLSARSASASP